MFCYKKILVNVASYVIHSYVCLCLCVCVCVCVFVVCVCVVYVCVCACVCLCVVCVCVWRTLNSKRTIQHITILYFTT